MTHVQNSYSRFIKGVYKQRSTKIKMQNNITILNPMKSIIFCPTRITDYEFNIL